MKKTSRPKSWTETVSLTFDPDNPRYKFCCESFNAIYGTIAVCILELLGTVGFMSHILLNYRENVMPIVVSCTIFILTVLVVALVFYGIFFGKSKAIFAHMVLQVSETVLLFIASIVLIFSLMDRVSAEEDENQKISGLVSIIACFFAGCFQIWFFLIVLSCYRYVKEKVQPVAV